jgi:methyl-accepting chemotaxis protein
MQRSKRARAGEAGRGFAVVAQEVKSLGRSNRQSTEEIAGQIGAIQSAAADAAHALQQVNEIIEDMSTIAASVASTVEEQNSAVNLISQGVHQASTESRGGAEAMSRVASATQDTHATAADVKSLADTLAGRSGRPRSAGAQFPCRSARGLTPQTALIRLHFLRPQCECARVLSCLSRNLAANRIPLCRIAL